MIVLYSRIRHKNFFKYPPQQFIPNKFDKIKKGF